MRKLLQAISVWLAVTPTNAFSSSSIPWDGTRSSVRLTQGSIATASSTSRHFVRSYRCTTRSGTSLQALSNSTDCASSSTSTDLVEGNQVLSRLLRQPLTLMQRFQSPENDTFRARALLIAAAALYGTNFSLVKILGTQTDLPVGVSSAMRFGLAALVLSPFLFQPSSATAKEGEIRPELGAALLGLEVGLWNSVGYVAQAVGLQTTDASKSAFICSLAVVTVPIIDFLTGKRLLQREFLGATMAIAGVAALELGGMTEMALSPGDLASLVQPVAFGIGFWKMENVMHKYPTEALRTTAGQLLAVFLGSLVYCIIGGDAKLVNWDQVLGWFSDPVILFALFWTGVITTALTVYMETLALKTLSAAETTLIFSTEPLWGAAFAAAVMGEQLGVSSAIGAILILSGCVYSNLGLTGVVSALTGKPATSSTTADPRIEPDSTEGNLLRVTATASVGGMILSVMNEMNVAARVVGLQATEFLEDIFPILGG